VALLNLRIWTLPGKPRERPLLLGTDLEKATALCQKVREGSAVVSSKVVVPAAPGILKAYDRQRLEDDELEDDEAGSGVGYIRLNRHWAYSFLRRMNYVRRKA